MNLGKGQVTFFWALLLGRTLECITGHYETLRDVFSLRDITGHYETLRDMTGNLRNIPDPWGDNTDLKAATSNSRFAPGSWRALGSPLVRAPRGS